MRRARVAPSTPTTCVPTPTPWPSVNTETLMQTPPATTRASGKARRRSATPSPGLAPTRVTVTGNRPMISEASATPALCTATDRPT